MKIKENLNFLKKIAQWGYVSLFMPNKSFVLPPLIQIEPTDYCNLNCQMCQRRSFKAMGVKLNQKNMTLKQFKKIIDEVDPHNLEITGFGEPLLNPHFVSMLAYAKKKSIVVSAFCNFTLMDEKKAEEIVKSGVDIFRVSLDVATAKTYQKIRGFNMFEKVLSGIKALVRKREELHSKTPFIRAAFVIQKDNLGEIEAFIKICHSLKINGAWLQLLDFNSFEDSKEKFWGEKENRQLEKTLRRAYKLCQRFNFDSNLKVLVEDSLPYWLAQQKPQPQDDQARTCLLPWLAPYVTVDGIVKPCCIAGSTLEKYVEMGDLKKQSFQGIWNNEKFQAFRKAVKAKKKKNLPKICQNCVPRTIKSLIGRPDIKRYLSKQKKSLIIETEMAIT